MLKVLVLGSAGMLGHVVYAYLKELNRYKIIDSSFPEKFHQDSLLVGLVIELVGQYDILGQDQPGPAILKTFLYLTHDIQTFLIQMHFQFGRTEQGARYAFYKEFKTRGHKLRLLISRINWSQKFLRTCF